MTEFTTIESADLASVNGGNKGKLIKKGAEYVGKAAKWGWNEVVKPGLIWAGVESLADKATKPAQPAQPQQ